MPKTTVRIGPETHAKLKDLAERSGEPMPAVLEKAVEAYRRQRFLEEANKAFAALREDPKACAGVTHQRRSNETNSSLRAIGGGYECNRGEIIQRLEDVYEIVRDPRRQYLCDPWPLFPPSEELFPPPQPPPQTPLPAPIYRLERLPPPIERSVPPIERFPPERLPPLYEPQ